jgi:hypothetical protein
MRTQLLKLTRSVTLAGIVGGALVAAAGPQAPPPPAPVQVPQPSQPPAGPTHAIHAKDPRVGLKAGIDDAGVAAKGLELVSHLPVSRELLGPELL